MADFTKQLEKSLLLRTEETAAQAAVTQFGEEAGANGVTPEQIWALWKEKMGYIQQSYLCSGRRVLLRYLAKRIRNPEWLAAHIGNLGKSAVLSIEEAPETIVYQKSRNTCYRFGTDMERAVQMTDQEEDDCCRLIRNLVCGPGNAEALSLIKNAFRANERTPWLTKEQAFRLGHLLGFDLEEMSAFLLRYFQDGTDRAHAGNSNTFNVKRSDDLIEFFCFLVGNQDPEELKATYQDRFGAIEKCDQSDPRARDITTEISGYIWEGEPDWANPALTPEEQREKFLTWLGENAEFLDVPSRSATELVRALVNTAIALYTDRGHVSTLIRLPYVLEDVMNDPAQLQAVWDEESCQAKTDMIFEMMEVFSANKRLDAETVHAVHEDPEKLWILDPFREEGYRLFNFIFPRATGEKNKEVGEAVRLQWRAAHYQHLQRLLAGTLAPMRGDVLLLIFIIANMIWFDSSKPKTAVRTQLVHFDTVAKQVLDGVQFSSIGSYYIGHYTEFAILSSIVYSSLNPKYTGLFWYTQLLARF